MLDLMTSRPLRIMRLHCLIACDMIWLVKSKRMVERPNISMKNQVLLASRSCVNERLLCGI